MANQDDNRSEELSDEPVCPNCLKVIEEGTAVIRGAASFCSLECVAAYHQAEFREHARRIATAAKQ
jgi:uncharacterized protein (UPF0212 family)